MKMCMDGWRKRGERGRSKGGRERKEEKGGGKGRKERVCVRISV